MKFFKMTIVSALALAVLLPATFIASEAMSAEVFRITSTMSLGTRTLSAHFNPSRDTWNCSTIGLVANRRVRRSAVRLQEGRRDTDWVWSENVTYNRNASIFARTSQFNNPFQVQVSRWDWRYRGH